VALSACSVDTRGTPQRAAVQPPVSKPGEPSKPTGLPPRISFHPASDHRINPAEKVSVSVKGGRLSSVRLINTKTGLVVRGRMSRSGTRWKAREDLGYGKSYRLTASARNVTGRVHRLSRFTTLRPAIQTAATFQTIGGYGLVDSATYGVGLVPIVHFDHPVKNKRAAVAALHVRSTPTVRGAWHWTDDQDVHYRPRHFWPAHTFVTIKAKVYGVKMGRGLYGRSDERASFTIGRRQVTVADDNSPQVDKVRIYNGAGHVLRTMNTSMGQHSGEYVNGADGRTWVNFYTLDGTYTVIAHENPAHMSSASYGLPPDQPHGYGTLTVPYSTKISVDGIYLHEFNSTIPEQDSGQDVSEGCLNLRTADAEWFYDHSLLGDPVIVHGAEGAPEIALWQGGDWSVPWHTWRHG
jgi:lipoprotein-anchoring transpeptidase ErfK/SrfK